MKNTVHLIGRIGKDATSREWQGKEVCNFMMATTSIYRDKTTGLKKEETQWHKCVLWQHENLYPYLKSGTMLSVQGSIRYDFFEKEIQGEKVNMLTTDIIVDEVVLLASPKQEAQ